MARTALAFLLLLAPAGCESDAFRCAHRDDCSDGYCETNGSCSTDDDSCSSGRRYVEHAQTEVANRCVVPGDGDAAVCEPRPSASTCDERCPGGCDAGVCVISCSGVRDCSEVVLVCPAGIPCEVQCGGPDSCRGLELECDASTSCVLDCGGLGSCFESAVHCGAGPCEVSCGGLESGPLDVECAESCGCDRSCGL